MVNNKDIIFWAIMIVALVIAVLFALSKIMRIFS